MLNVFFYVTMGLFLLVSVFLILIVLIQKGRGGGLASAFGGAGGNTAFGSKTGDVLTWATSVLFGVFLVLAIALNLLTNKVHESRTTVAGSAPAPQNSAPAGAPIPSNVPPAAGEPGVRDPQVPPAQRGAEPTPEHSSGGPVSVMPATQPSNPK